ncbi:hypothetical protein LXA43DRAFT_1096102 [Ganoderma leucocontextum]|nr:hypothetical protein LXA43DRAFT_1096102 [Ganoderma leucocontextum]
MSNHSLREPQSSTVLRSMALMATLLTSSSRTRPTSKRTDKHSGSIENRTKFPLEVVNAVIANLWAKTGLRLSPWDKGLYGDMRMDDPVPTDVYLVDRLKQNYPNLAYLHLVSSIAPFNVPPEDVTQADFIYRMWAPRPVITTGARYDRDSSGLKVAEESDTAEHSWQTRICRSAIALNRLDPTTIYATRGNPDGYIPVLRRVFEVATSVNSKWTYQ